MICFLFRVMTYGFGGSSGCCFGICGIFAACCALRGLKKCLCCRCRLRNCGCIKWCLRKTGSDTFDDFECMILVHEVTYTTKNKRVSMIVRVTAGDHVVETEESRDVFQQPLAIMIEQGTPMVKIECLHSSRLTGSHKSLATLKLDIQQDINDPKKQGQEQTFQMKQKNKDFVAPKISLTINKNYQEELEKGAMLVQGMGISKETGVVLRQQLGSQKDEQSNAPRPGGYDSDTGAGPAVSQEVELLMKGCSGPLVLYGSWGSTKKVYVAVQYKYEARRYSFGVWKDREDFDRGLTPKPEIDMMKVFSVQPDPSRKEVFVIEYAPGERERKRVMFQRQDRSRDAWVEMLQLLIKTLRSEKEVSRRKLMQQRTGATPSSDLNADSMA